MLFFSEELRIEDGGRVSMYSLVIVVWVYYFHRDDMQSDQKKLENAIKDVLKTALVHDGLARGLKEAVKALDRLSIYLYYHWILVHCIYS